MQVFFSRIEVWQFEVVIFFCTLDYKSLIISRWKFQSTFNQVWFMFYRIILMNGLDMYCFNSIVSSKQTCIDWKKSHFLGYMYDITTMEIKVYWKSIAKVYIEKLTLP